MNLRRVNRPVSAFEGVVRGCIVPLYKARKNNSKVVDTLDVDQFSGQKFMQNPQGFVMNDIMVFEECQSDSVARAVLNRIKVLHPESISQDLTPDEMFASIIPANYGSPAEFVSAHKAVAERVYKLRAAESKAMAEKMAKEAEIKQFGAISDAQSELDGSIPKGE